MARSRPRHTPRSLAPPWLLLPLLMMLATAGGCGEMLGVMTNAFAGPRKIPARYEPAARTTVVFVDDPGQRLPGVDLPGLIAGRVADRLVEKTAIEQVIPPRRIDRLRGSASDFSRWPIDRVGAEVEAEQVLYIQITDFELSESDAIYRPTGKVRVKWIDATTGQRLWPDRAAHEHGLAVTTRQQYRHMEGAGAMTESILSRELAEMIAADVAGLFHERRAPETGSRR